MTDYGPLQSFELTWAAGYVETIRAHQVSYRGGGDSARIEFHGDFDGRWTLVLAAIESDLTRIRNVTKTEPTVEQTP